MPASNTSSSTTTRTASPHSPSASAATGHKSRQSTPHSPTNSKSSTSTPSPSTIPTAPPSQTTNPAPQPHPQPIRAAHGEQRQRETAPEPTNPAAWLTVLAPQPNPADAERATWNRAAIAIERDRNAYNIDPAEPAALGPPPPPGQFQQRHEQRKAAEAVIDAIELLHPTDSNAHATLQERIINTPGLIPANHEQDRSPGWEP